MDAPHAGAWASIGRAHLQEPHRRLDLQYKPGGARRVRLQRGSGLPRRRRALFAHGRAAAHGARQGRQRGRGRWRHLECRIRRHCIAAALGFGLRRRGRDHAVRRLRRAWMSTHDQLRGRLLLVLQ